MGGGGRALFTGDGGSLFVSFLLYYMAPMLGAYIVGMGVIFTASFIDQQAKANGVLAAIGGLIGSLVILVGLVGVAIAFGHKFNEFHYSNTRLDGQQCE